jgi:phytanoyl-CoA hydroxylase
MSAVITNDDINQYWDNGYLVLRQLIDENHINMLNEYIYYFIEKFSSQLAGREINWLDKERMLVNSVHKTDIDPSSPITALLKSTLLQSVLTKLMGEQALPRHAEIFAKPAHSGLASPMHQDNFYWCLAPSNALTVWLSITGADKDNGGVSYYKGSHKLGLIQHENSYAPGSSQKIPDQSLPDDELLVTPELEPGDVLIHHSLTIHGSAPNKSSRDRRGITFQYQGESCRIDNAMQHRYTNALESQVKQREISQKEKADARI